MRGAIAVTAIACVLVAVTSGCARRGRGPHVALWVPPPSATSAERHAAYHALRPVRLAEHRPHWLSNDTTVTEYLVLNDGREIWHVSDMLTVVDPTSPTARSARAHDSARSRKPLAILVISAGMMVGAGLLVSGIVGTKDDTDPPVPPALTITLGSVIMVGGLGGGVTMAITSGRRQERERKKALTSYDEDLRARLRLCEIAGVVADCPPGGR
jgi:hypothetical protein